MTSLLDDQRFYRTGRDHRGGWLVTFADVHRHFGFKSLKVGRWVTAAEKEATAQWFFDALSDLQDILNAPVVLLSLRQSLSLAYGTGGQYRVMAHYEPATRTFALAKNAGPGAIAHEWFHAFDHYIADHLLQSPRAGIFASDGYWQGAHLRQHPLNAQLAHCFDVVFYTDDQATPTDYVTRSLAVDQAQGQTYYSLPYELMARAFEAFVQDATVKNNFLASGTKRSADAKRGLYPQGAHRHAINRAFAQYFGSLGAVLRRQHPDA